MLQKRRWQGSAGSPTIPLYRCTAVPPYRRTAALTARFLCVRSCCPTTAERHLVMAVSTSHRRLCRLRSRKKSKRSYGRGTRRTVRLHGTRHNSRRNFTPGARFSLSSFKHVGWMVTRSLRQNRIQTGTNE
jgi:hypothetical protein